MAGEILLGTTGSKKPAERLHAVLFGWMELPAPLARATCSHCERWLMRCLHGIIRRSPAELNVLLSLTASPGDTF